MPDFHNSLLHRHILEYSECKNYYHENNSFKYIRTPQESMVLQNGKIVFIGTTDATNNFLAANNLNSAGACRTIELAGKTILPGINYAF